MTTIDLGPFPDAAGYAEAADLDRDDRLASHRSRYLRPDPELIYLDGNSLGRAPAEASQVAEAVVGGEWADRLIRSWNESWWDLQVELGDRLAPLLGAGPGEVMISDSTSVNLYKLAHAALTATPPDRTRVVTDDLNFPSDIYILDSVARQTGRELEIVASDGIHGPLEGLAALIDDRTALVSLSHTVFQSGYTYDLAVVSEMAHQAGAMTLWDCSHSVGALPIELDAAGVDLAVGSTYKHLNGGPGAPAFLYVPRRLQDELINPISGWWSHADPFALDLHYRPVTGIRRFHTGTMPILSLAMLQAGLDDVVEAGVKAIRAKSVAMAGFLVDQIEQHLAPLGFELASPAEPERRGAHVAVRHDRAWPIDVALIERAKVIPDFRAPDTIRLGLSPLYTTFVEIHTAVQRLVEIVDSGTYEHFADRVSKVT